ncbi:MAG TPA: HEAT repeat domain-containing protein [Longimicrobiaceae bacterium]|nr:HEAT repeat domain-containing protein [Longimicrobiaceae bacterium]
MAERTLFRGGRPARAVLALAALLLLGGCAELFSRQPPPRWGAARLRYETVAVLAEEPTPAYFRERARLEVMGPELDEILIGIIEDGEQDERVRVNAMVLLAYRGGFGAVSLLRRYLAASGSDALRAAAAEGLQRFVADSVAARNALRAAVGDPSRTVRLTALQSFDVTDAPLVRALLATEEDPQIRTIARQLLTVFEGRGAALARDDRGQLRTSGADSVPQIVFQPTQRDTSTGLEVGAVWVQLPGSALVPLAQVVEVANGVVPAFFSPTRAAVVYEADREVRVRDLRTGQTVRIGRGIAPRPVPFTDRFVYLRELPNTRRETPAGVTFEYAVLGASFSGGPVEDLGRLRATLRENRAGAWSPAREMVVAEESQSFVLRGPGLTPLALPWPADRGAPPPP